MKSLSNFLEKYLVPLAVKLSNNIYLGSVSLGFSYLLPVIMVGALFTLFTSFNFAIYQDFITSIGLKTILSFASTYTTNMLAVYAVFLIAKAYGEKIGREKESIIVGVLALVAFLILIPTGAHPLESGSTIAYLPVKFLGAPGLFSAIIVALVTALIYFFFIKNNIVIKLPDSVPPTIGKSFSAILPGMAIVFIFGLVRHLFTMTSYDDFNTAIYTIVQKPLVSLGASPITYILLIVVCSLLWFVGIHGGMIVMPILSMLYMPALLENLAAFEAGTQLPNIITYSTWSLIASLGGAGGTLGLCILMLFLSKSVRYKTLGKLAIGPGICGINEPITFGYPMMLNTVMLIPMVVTPVVTFLISYFAMSAGIVPSPNGVTVALGTPVIFSGLMAIGWQGAVLQVFLIVIQMAFYFPFFRLSDKMAYDEEQANEQVKSMEEKAVNA